MKRLILTALLLAGGCAAYSGPVAEDVVCKSTGDLGCVRIRIREDTPRATYKGTTYYFCCEGCRDRFVKEPERYVAK